MSNAPDKGRQTSRRRFTKTIGGVLASIPFISSFVNAEEKRRSSIETFQRKSGSNRTQDQKSGLVFRTHDTPPPITFENGSFVLERTGQFLGSDIVTNPATSRKEYRVRPFFGSTAVPAHIKIVEGSGEVLYRNDRAASCVISIELEGPGGDRSMVNARTSADKTRFVIDIDAAKSLDLGNAANNDKPTSRKRDRRYRHSGPEMSMREITIKEGAKILYNVLTEDLPADGSDLKVMIWVESVEI